MEHIIIPLNVKSRKINVAKETWKANSFTNTNVNHVQFQLSNWNDYWKGTDAFSWQRS